MKRWLSKMTNGWPFHRKQRQIHWEYKVVQMFAQPQADPDDVSRKLGGSLSAEALRAQFPEYYNPQNGRQQICDFLNQLGLDGWELIQVQQVAALPLMIFKRPILERKREAMAKPKKDPSQQQHVEQRP